MLIETWFPAFLMTVGLCLACLIVDLLMQPRPRRVPQPGAGEAQSIKKAA